MRPEKIQVTRPEDRSINEGTRANFGVFKIAEMPRSAQTLLVVEDEADVRHLAAAVLEAEGYRVLRASNGLEALRIARESTLDPISLVVSDVVMPQMDGKVMAEWLQTISPDLKVLFTSGYSDNVISERGTLVCDIEYLPKPYTASALIRKVREVLDNP